MLIPFTESDVLGATIVPEGWYEILIEDVEDKASKDNQSINSWIKGKLLKNDDTGETTFKSKDKEGKDIDVKIAGVPTPFPWIISSKGAWAAVGLFNSVFGDTIQPGDRRDTGALKGRKVVGFIGKTIYEGTLKNAFTNQWRAPKSE